MIFRATHRLFLRGQLRPSHTLQRRLRAKIILISVAICLFISIVLTAVRTPQYSARVVIHAVVCKHGTLLGPGACDDCIPFSTKLTQRGKDLASDLKRALE